MKRLILVLLFLFGINNSANSQTILSPYIKVGTTGLELPVIKQNIKTLLKANGFQVVGGYHPAQKPNLYVIVFTRKDLKNAVVTAPDRGALAAAQKIGLRAKNGKVEISYTNPDYMLRAYLGDNYAKHKAVYDKFHSDLKKTLSVFGNDFIPFGGKEKASKLKKYHYKIMMPYFTDPTELKTYSSFDEGYQTIMNNLKKGKAQVKPVYKIVYPNKHIAVFGVALKGNDKGSEAFFLPKIGTKNIAAMPYEIILQGNKATMLPGKYRLAVSWPELSMGTFMKIVRTPGKIEDRLKAVCE